MLGLRHSARLESRLECVDQLDEVAVSVFAEVLGPYNGKLVLGLDMTNLLFSPLDQLLEEEVPQSYPRAQLASCRSGCRRREKLRCCRHRREQNQCAYQAPGRALMLEQQTTSFMASAAATDLASTVDYTVNLCSPTLEMIGSFEKRTIYDEIDFPMSGLLPQVALENAVTLHSPCA